MKKDITWKKGKRATGKLKMSIEGIRAEWLKYVGRWLWNIDESVLDGMEDGEGAG